MTEIPEEKKPACAQMNRRENVERQYRDPGNLSVRSRLHATYSTNPVGWVSWLFDHYRFRGPCRILELGCGAGMQWKGRIESLPAGSTLVLSDLSDGMMRAVWEQYAPHKNVLAQRVDIQQIPFPDGCFDYVIANHMLYHVPDLPAALGEVRRVLAPEGSFFAATNGENGMRRYLHEALQRFNPSLNAFSRVPSFTLQNGRELLSPFFTRVERTDYEDSLAITRTGDLIAWLHSSISIAGYTEADLVGLYDFFEEIRLREGSIRIPKEAGLFTAQK